MYIYHIQLIYVLQVIINKGLILVSFTNRWLQVDSTLMMKKVCMGLDNYRSLIPKTCIFILLGHCAHVINFIFSYFYLCQVKDFLAEINTIHV